MNKEAQALIDAGTKYPAEVSKSTVHEHLMELAMDHANWMARWRHQGHQGFRDRAEQIREKLGSVLASEIVAESWAHQADLPLLEIGLEMYHCWEQSPGHWRVASKAWPYAGFAMAQSSKGIWYACILVAEES